MEHLPSVRYRQLPSVFLASHRPPSSTKVSRPLAFASSSPIVTLIFGERQHALQSPHGTSFLPSLIPRCHFCSRVVTEHDGLFLAVDKTPIESTAPSASPIHSITAALLVIASKAPRPCARASPPSLPLTPTASRLAP